MEAEGWVRVVRSARLCLVELANGHQLWAFVPRRRAAVMGPWQAGDRVTLELSLFDLSKAKIVGWQKTKTT
jgi:translation initiation factor IF-1